MALCVLCSYLERKSNLKWLDLVQQQLKIGELVGLDQRLSCFL